MKNILVPTDFSPCAANALRYALDIAAYNGATVHVLNVLFPNEGVDNSIYNAFWAEDYLEQRKRDIVSWVKRNSRREHYSNVAVTTTCVIGFPVGAIAEKAQQIHADLVIMGTTGATGIRGVLLGSVASGVLTKTRLPVLAIPKKAVLHKNADTVFATDYNFKVSEKNLALLHEMLQFLGSRLKVVHVLDKPGEQPDHSREAGIRQKFGYVTHDFHYLHDKDIPQAISNFIEATDAGLQVAIAHEHSMLHRLFNDSITRRLAHRTRVPLLVLHDQT